MAAVNPPWAIEADSHHAYVARQPLSAIVAQHSSTGGVVGAGDLLVTGGSGNTVSVASGSLFIPGSVTTTGGTQQGMYFGINDAAVSLPITPNGGAITFWNIEACVNDQFYSGNPGVTNNQWGLLATGQTGSFPTRQNNSVLLSQVQVPAGAGSSASYTFTDQRPYAWTRPQGHIHQTVAQSISSGSATGLTNMATADILFGGMTVVSNALVVPQAGTYLVSGQIEFTSGSGTGAYQATLLFNGSQLNYATGSVSQESSGSTTPNFCTMVRAAATNTFQLACFQNSGSSQSTVVSNQRTRLDVIWLSA